MPKINDEIYLMGFFPLLLPLADFPSDRAGLHDEALEHWEHQGGKLCKKGQTWHPTLLKTSSMNAKKYFKRFQTRFFFMDFQQ